MIQESETNVLRMLSEAVRRIASESASRERRIGRQASGWRWFGDDPVDVRLRHIASWVHSKPGPSRAYPAAPRVPLPVSRRRGTPPARQCPRGKWPLPADAASPPSLVHRVALHMALSGDLRREAVVTAVGHANVDVGLQWAVRVAGLSPTGDGRWGAT